MASSHTLTFSRLRANFIVDKELIGKQDPYVIFQSGSAKTQTKAIKGVGTGTAEWKESYTLESFSPKSSSVVEVTVYNHNHLLPDAVIGSGQVDLSNQGQSSLSGSGEPISVILVDKKGQEVGTVQFVTNGGGYSGRSGTGTGSGVGTGSGTGVGTGSSYGSHSGTGSGLGSAAGAGAAGAAGGALVGKGVGSDARTAQHASDKAAREGRDVTIEGRDRVGVGHPTSATGSHSHSGVGSGTGSAVGAAAGAATGHHGHHSGTGPAVGAAAGATPGHHGHHSGTGSAVGAAADAATGHHGHHHGHHSGTGITGSETGVTGSRGVQEGVTGTGVTSGSAVDRDTVYGVKEGDVIDRKYYVGQDSRPQDQALVEQYREHNPYAKDYETTVQHTGRERLVNSQIEALGTRERVIGQDHQVQSHPHHEIARHLPAEGASIDGSRAGAIDQRPGGEGWVQTKPGPVCDTNTFSISGNRTVDKERVTDLREHRDFEKEFEVKTRLVGERALDRGTDAEILNRERVLVDEKNKIACEGHPTATAEGGATLASQGQGVGTGTGYGSGSTGTGYGSSSTGTGAGYGSGTTGAGYGQGQGQGRSTTGEKIAGVIPGTEENSDKKQGYRPGQGPDQNQGNVTAGEKAASYIPGSTENKEKKAGYA